MRTERFRGVDNLSARFHPKVSLFWRIRFPTARKAVLDGAWHKSLAACAVARGLSLWDAVSRKRVFSFLSEGLFFLPCLVVGGVRIKDLTPIQVAPIQGGDDDLRRCQVGGYGDITGVAHTEQLMLGGVEFGGGAGVAEAKQHVDLVISDAGSHLLLSSLIARHQAVDVETRCLGDIFGGRCGGAQIMLAQNTTVGDTKLSHQLFFHVVRDNSNFHPIFLPSHLIAVRLRCQDQKFY